MCTGHYFVLNLYAGMVHRPASSILVHVIYIISHGWEMYLTILQTYAKLHSEVNVWNMVWQFIEADSKRFSLLIKLAQYQCMDLM